MASKGKFHAIEKNTEPNVWACGFGECMEDAAFIVHEERRGKLREKGACEKHAAKWARGCVDCMNKVSPRTSDDTRETK